MVKIMPAMAVPIMLAITMVALARWLRHAQLRGAAAPNGPDLPRLPHNGRYQDC